MYKSKELESTFEVLEPGILKKKMIKGCVYRQRSME